jgi:hypothetical protein
MGRILESGQIEMKSVTELPPIVNPPPTAPFFRFTDLRRLIEKRHITKIESLLPLLPEDLRAHFTLVHKSESRMQGASEENPRAVIFGSTGRLILTFNGDKSQLGFNVVEALSFDNASKKFELNEIDFSKPNQVRFSETNPAKCTACHGFDPRPIWNEYRFWPGVFGAHDDYLKPGGAIESGIPSPDQTDSPELKKFKSFRRSALSHPRYRYLGWNTEDECFPYHCKPDPFNKSLSNSPNSILTLVNVLNNSIAISDRVSRSSNFNNFKYTLVYTLSCQGVTEGENPYLKWMSRSASLPDHELWVSNRKSWLMENILSNSPLSFFGIEYGASSTALRFDSDGDKAERKQNYPLVSEFPNRGAFTNSPIGSGMSLDGSSNSFVTLQLIRIIAKNDPSLNEMMLSKSGWNAFFKSSAMGQTEVTYEVSKDLMDYIDQEKALIDPSARNSFCEYFKSKSNMESKSSVIAPGAEAPATERLLNFIEDNPGDQILKNSGCITCHDTPSISTAPKIPFGNAHQFANYIKEHSEIGIDAMVKIKNRISGTPADMPLSGMPLDKSQIEILMKHLNEMAK